MIERRGAKRRRLVQHLSVYDRTTDRLFGKSADITTKGVLIITDQALPVGTDVELRIRLPQPLFGIEHVEVDGQVMWRRKDANPGAYDVGVAFTSLSKRDEVIIGQLIATYSMVG